METEEISKISQSIIGYSVRLDFEQTSKNENSFISVTLEKALGQFPESARVLKSNNKSYVIAPIGHLIEESYTPYLQFNKPSLPILLQ